MKPTRPSSPGGGSAGDPSRPNNRDETHAAQFSRWGLGRRSIPAKQPVMKPTRPSLPVGARPAIHPGWGLGRRSIPAKQPVMKPTRPSSPGGGSAGDPSRLNRVASQPVMKPTRPSSPGIPPSAAGRLAGLGDPSRLFTASLRAAHRCVSVEIHPGQFSRWGLLPHAPCQPGPHREDWPHRENWASPPPGELAGLGAHVGFTTGCYRMPGG